MSTKVQKLSLDIVIIRDSFRTLTDIVIVDLTCTDLDLVQHASTMTTHAIIHGDSSVGCHT
jgi:hypothetical protein